MTSDNPFFMNFDVNDFMSKFTVPGMENEYSGKLMDMYKKNLDAFVAANTIISESYASIASRQMEIFQNSLKKLSSLTPEQAGKAMEGIFPENLLRESAAQMADLVTMATQAHKEAGDVLTARVKEITTEISAWK